MKPFITITMMVCGLLLVFTASSTQAQSSNQDYVGGSACIGCHGNQARIHAETPHGLALQSTDADKTPIIADFSTGEEVRTVTFPDGETRAFTEADIRYAIGVGRHTQAYVYESARNNQFVVLPAIWNDIDQTWMPYALADEWLTDPAHDFVQSCVGCHATGIVQGLRGITWDDGVNCEACHGGGEDHIEAAMRAESPPSIRDLRAIRTNIVVSPDPQICGQCHSQGTEPDEQHPYPINYQPGDDLLDEGVFTLVEPDDDIHWWATGHAKSPNMQFNEWLNGAHANALQTMQESEFADDSCLACHSGDYRWAQPILAAQDSGERGGDALEPITLDTATLGIVCTTCHTPHPDDENRFEASLRDTAYNVCIDCHSDANLDDGIHAASQQMFEGVAFDGAIDAIPSTHLTAEGGPDCATCHMAKVPVNGILIASHSFDVITPAEALAVDGLTDTCSQCHGEQVDPATLQTVIDEVQLTNGERIGAVQAAISDESPEWIPQAVAFIEQDPTQGIHNFAYTSQLLRVLERELGIVEPVEDLAIAPIEGTEVPEDVIESAPEEAELSTVAIVIMVLSVLVVVIFAFRVLRPTPSEDAS